MENKNTFAMLYLLRVLTASLLERSNVAVNRSENGHVQRGSICDGEYIVQIKHAPFRPLADNRALITVRTIPSSTPNPPSTLRPTLQIDAFRVHTVNSCIHAMCHYMPILVWICLHCHLLLISNLYPYS